jgi:spore maturation protein SpmA/spore maturation protein SpmB
MNGVFVGIVVVAFLTAAWRQVTSPAPADTPSPMAVLSSEMLEAAAGAVELAIGLVGVMALFLGLMKVAEAGGLLAILARLLRPLMTRLFPEVPPNHPAMGAMILNLSANALGMGNAATPFGIRAMQELDTLNKNPGTATDAMALFLAINTSSVVILPTTVIALRAAAGSADPAGILPTTLFASLCATLAAVLAARGYQRLARRNPSPVAGASSPSPRIDYPGPSEPLPSPSAIDISASPHDADPFVDPGAYPLWVSVSALAALGALIPATVIWGDVLSPWIIPSLMVGFLLFGVIRGVRVYEMFVEGAQEGFQVALRIIPYLVAILVAVAMLRASGALDAIVGLVGAWTAPLGLPAEALPMALLRPFSGSGAFALLASIINDPEIGPDRYVGYLVSTIQGSTETTFYVLAVYFGAVRVRRIRHTLAAALTADLVAVVAAVVSCRLLFGTL